CCPFQQARTPPGLDMCLNYLVQEARPMLRLDFSIGIPAEAVRALESRKFGQAVCGCVAQEKQRIVVENVPECSDPRVELVRSLGIRAYACFPLLMHERLIGTLSFGSRSRASFDPDELELMEAVSAQVAAALERLRLIRELRQRTEALAAADR